MIAVSVKNLVEAIREADTFKLPDMSDGTEYLYRSVYNKLAQDMDVRLSELDFDAFEAEDVNSLGDLYSDVFERNHYTVNGIASTLREAMPVCKAVGYV